MKVSAVLLRTVLLRYCYIMRKEQVQEFGTEKVKRLFYYISIIVPLLAFTLWNLTIPHVYIEGGTEANECFKTAYTDLAEVVECRPDNNQTGHPYMKPWAQGYVSPYYHLAWQFLPEEFAEEILYFLSLIPKSILIVAALIIVEGFLYWKIFRHINR